MAFRFPSGLGLDGVSLSAERDAEGEVLAGGTSEQNCVVSTGDIRHERRLGAGTGVRERQTHWMR